MVKDYLREVLMVKKILSINHSDSLGQTGIQADLGDFQLLDCFSFSAITNLLQHNNKDSSYFSDEILIEQIDSVLSISSVDVIKLRPTVPLTQKVLDKLSLISQKTPIILELTYKQLKQPSYNKLSDLAYLVVVTELPQNISQNKLPSILWSLLLKEDQLIAYDSTDSPYKALVTNKYKTKQFNYPSVALSNYLATIVAKNKNLII